MSDLILDGVEKDLPASTDFGAWVSNELAGSTWKHAILRGDHTTTDGINLTSCRQGVVVEAFGLYLECQGTTGLDITDSTGIRWHGGRFHGVLSGSTLGEVGVLSARCTEQSYRAAGKNRFHAVDITGDWDIAAHLNIGAEQNLFADLRAENGSGPAVIMAANATGYAPSSLNSGLTPENTSSEALCTFTDLRATCSKAGASAVIVDGFDRIVFGGQTSISSKSHALHVCTTKEAIMGLVCDALYARPLSGIDGSAVYFDGSASEPIIGACIRLLAGENFNHTFEVGTQDLEFGHCDFVDGEPIVTPDWTKAKWRDPVRRWERSTVAEWEEPPP